MNTEPSLPKEKELETLIKRYIADLISYADRLEAFAGEPNNPRRKEIQNSYKLTAEALLEAKAELKKLRGQPLTKAQVRVIKRGIE